MIAAQAPELHEVLAQGLREGWGYVFLDGTLIASTRSPAPSAAVTTGGTPASTNATAATSSSCPPVGVPRVGLRGRAGLDPRHHRRPTHALPALYTAAAAGCPRWRTRATPVPGSASRCRSRATTSPPTTEPATC